jgi:AbiV family abortive infection protein
MTSQGPISLPQLIELRRAIIANVRDLAGDTRVLHNAGRWPRAFAVALLCAEETAKLFAVDAVVRLVRSGQAPDWKQVWRELNQHEIKLGLFIQLLFELSQMGTSPAQKTLQELAKSLEGAFPSEQAEQLHHRKLDALYVGFRQHQVVRPTEAVDASLAKAGLTMIGGVENVLDSIRWDD